VIRDVVVAVLLVAGLALMMLSAIGLVVMRSAFDRLHYTGPAAFGGLLVAIAVLVRESFSLIGDKSLAVGVFLVASGTILVHVTGRAARVRELGDWRLRRGEGVEVEDP
jgi:multisubunit Na+/H+ antiporter MnhG subunit